MKLYKIDSFDAEIGLRIVRGISNIQACYPILVVPPSAIINPEKPDMDL